MNTTESTIEVSDTSETPERFTVELIPSADLIDGADLASELVLAAELTDEQEEIAIEAIAISPEGLKNNAKLWRMRDWIEKQIAPQRAAICQAREELFRGYDERTQPATIRMAGMTRN
jgi:hypothetical protein